MRIYKHTFFVEILYSYKLLVHSCCFNQTKSITLTYNLLYYKLKKAIHE